MGLIIQMSYGQQRNYETLFNKDKTHKIITDYRIYGGLAHQHQDFFNRAFSFQGIEAGVLLNNSLLLGVFGSAFVSNLEVDIANNPTFLLINQAGITGGMVRNDSKLLHTGFLLSIGYFSLAGDSRKLQLFQASDHEITVSGLVLSPQVFAELNITGWLKFRSGLAYNSYSFDNNKMVAKSDLENFSLNFGFLLGKFNKRHS